MTQVRDDKQLTIETSEIIGRMCFYEHDERRISDVESKGEVKGKERRAHEGCLGSEATKDVTSCDKLRLEANTHQAADPPNGATRRAKSASPVCDRSEPGELETSQYPEEEKTIVIAQVVASERAIAQTAGVATRLAGL